MNGVTDPSETYFKQGLWAYDANAKAWVELEVDASGYLKVTGLTLAPGAATAAHQVTQNTALQLIDDLYNALHSVHLDELDVHIDGQTNDVEIVQQAPADLAASLHGYIGGAWQKAPLLWGYSGRWEERIILANAVAGGNILTCTAVAGGEVWVLQAASIVNKNSTSGPNQIYLKSTSTYPVLAMTATIAANTSLPWDGAVVLAEGDVVRGEFGGCTLNDDLHLNVWGYKMDIDL